MRSFVTGARATLQARCMRERWWALASFALATMGCASSGVGDPCTPEAELVPTFGQSTSADLVIDVNAMQCETRVCLSHYFQGRVSCPFGNGRKGGQATPGAKCLAVPGKRGLFTLDGALTGGLCCPQLGDLEQRPLDRAVGAQCAERPAADAVYCTCRCDVPDDPAIDRKSINLCACPSGFTCTPLCDNDHGSCSVAPKGRWGSYCVKNGPNGAGFDPRRAKDECATPLEP